jgi:hypothetical protein
MFTRLIAIFLAILLASFVCTVALPVGKATSVPVQLYVEPASVESATLVPGTTFNVSVNVGNIPASPGVAGAQFELHWNATLLNCTGIQEIMFHNVTPSADWSNIWSLALSYNNTGGYADYGQTWMDITTAEADNYAPVSGNQTVANLEFKVIAVGECALHFTVSKLSDPQGNVVPHDTTDGLFSNLPPPPTPKPALLYVNPGSISNASLTQSNNFTININIINASGVLGLGFELGFNASALHVNSVVNGSFFPSLITPITQINNTAGFVSFNVSLTTPLNGNGTVAVIQLQVEANHVSNSTLHLYNVGLAGSTGQPLPFTTIDGSFTNVAYLPGDLNHDGVVDIYDALILAKAFNSRPGDPNWNPEADLLDHGVIDIFDAIALCSHFGQTS